jgi:ribonuclease III
VPKLDIRVVGGGGSRRAAEQSAAKKALEVAISLAPAAVKRARKTVKREAQLSLPVATVQSPDGAADPDKNDAVRAAAAE